MKISKEKLYNTISKKILLLVFSLAVLSIIIFVQYEQGHSQSCNVAVVSLTGELFTTLDPTDTTDQQVTSDQVDHQLESARNNPHIKAVVLSVNSNGGDPVAGEDILKELKSITNKPTVALARSTDDSAAYIASMGADTIFAANESLVADIGATASYTDNSVKDQQDGVTFNQLSLGEYKDMGNPDKPLTADERALEMTYVTKDYNYFVQLITDNRHMPFATAEALANGSEYLGMDAIKNGLIDHLGNMLDVQQYLTEKIGKKVVLCK